MREGEHILPTTIRGGTCLVEEAILTPWEHRSLSKGGRGCSIENTRANITGGERGREGWYSANSTGAATLGKSRGEDRYVVVFENLIYPMGEPGGHPLLHMDPCSIKHDGPLSSSGVERWQVGRFRCLVHCQFLAYNICYDLLIQCPHAWQI